jgi:hypothetical protein
MIESGADVAVDVGVGVGVGVGSSGGFNKTLING